MYLINEKLATSFHLNAREVDFIDIIVPVGVSFIRNDGVKFVRQLADHCDHVYSMIEKFKDDTLVTRKLNPISFRHFLIFPWPI